MHTSNELYSHSLRCKPHGREFLHHQKTLVMAYRCLYEGNLSLFPFYIIMFYTARCSFYPAPKQPAKPERKNERHFVCSQKNHLLLCQSRLSVTVCQRQAPTSLLMEHKFAVAGAGIVQNHLQSASISPHKRSVTSALQRSLWALCSG